MARSPSDEYPLAQPVDSPLWSENFALALSDAKNGLSFLYSIGTWYGDTSVWREKLSVELPDGQILVGRNYGRNTSGNTVSASLSRYTIEEPEKKVRLTWNGPVMSYSFEELMTRGAWGGLARNLSLDVVSIGFAPLWDMHEGHEEDATGIMGAMHTEQLSHCEGSLRYEGREFRIDDALSCRDHSRGKRDFSSFRNHCWINGEFPGKRSFHVYAAQVAGVEGLALAAATVIEGGRHHRAQIERVDFIGSPSDHKQPQTVILASDLGRMVIDVTKVRTTLPVSAVAPFEAQTGVQQRGTQGLIFDETIELQWDGNEGLGWSERGFLMREP